VRGSGLGTQILLANRGTLAAVFTPDDNSYTHYTPKLLTTDVAVGALGFGLTFGAGNTFWGTQGAQSDGPLLRLSFDTTAGTATTLNTNASPGFPGTITPILAMPSSNLLAGITMVAGADVVRLYDISSPASPVLLDRKPFATANNNNIFGGSLALGTNGVLYALDSDNGLMAYTLVATNTNSLPPAFFLMPATQLAPAGNNVTFTSGADSSLPIKYQWLYFGTNFLANATNQSLTLTNVQSTNAGSYSVIASNSLGSVTSSVAVLTVPLTPPTTLIAYEPFNEPVATLIGGQGQWFTSASAGAISNGNLTVPGLAASTGNMLSWGTTTVSMRMTNGITNLSGSVYFSFAYQVDGNSTIPAPGASGDSIAGFVSGNTSTYFAPKINIHTNTTGAGFYEMGVFKGGTEVNGAYAPNVLAAGQTVFVVASYTFSDGASDDTCSLWVNPDPSTFGATNPPTPSAVVPNTTLTADQPQIDRFFLRQAGGPSRSYADEVRVGLTWADVTPPFIASPTLRIINNGNGTVTMSWPSAATGFNLFSSTSLTLPRSSWPAVTDPVIVSGTNRTVTVSTTGGLKFFTLKQ